MRLPNWTCGRCGKCFSRKWNGVRHLNICHDGGGVIVPFVEYVAGRNSGIYLPASPSTYEHKEKNPSDIWKEEFRMWKENYYRSAARQMFNNFFNRNIPVAAASLHQRHSSNNNDDNQVEPYDLWTGSEKVFGIEASVCVKCLSIQLDLVCFSEKENCLRRIKLTHDCDPTFIATSELLTDADEIVKNPHHLIPTVLSQYVKIWTNNRSILIAIELHLPLAKIVKLIIRSQHGDGLKHLILPFSSESCLDIDLTSSENNKLRYQWAERTVYHKYSVLNDVELTDFLNMVKNSTFAFFRIELKKQIKRYYLMAIAPAANQANQPKIFLDEQERTNLTP
jgi:hypothetical protein